MSNEISINEDFWTIDSADDMFQLAEAQVLADKTNSDSNIKLAESTYVGGDETNDHHSMHQNLQRQHQQKKIQNQCCYSSLNNVASDCYNRIDNIEYVVNPFDKSILRDHKGIPVTVDRILATKPLRHELLTRPGPGGRKLTYMSGESITRTLNDVFGFDGWHLQILKTERTVCEQENPNGSDHNSTNKNNNRVVQQQKRWSVAYMAHVRITHVKSGTYKEDLGAGDAVDRHLPTALQHAMKASITDALKRSARHFGDKLGNVLYQGDFNVNSAPKTLSDALNQYDLERTLQKGKSSSSPNYVASTLTDSVGKNSSSTSVSKNYDNKENSMHIDKNMNQNRTFQPKPGVIGTSESPAQPSLPLEPSSMSELPVLLSARNYGSNATNTMINNKIASGSSSSALVNQSRSIAFASAAHCSNNINEKNTNDMMRSETNGTMVQESLLDSKSINATNKNIVPSGGITNVKYCNASSSSVTGTTPSFVHANQPTLTDGEIIHPPTSMFTCTGHIGTYQHVDVSIGGNVSLKPKDAGNIENIQVSSSMWISEMNRPVTRSNRSSSTGVSTNCRSSLVGSCGLDATSPNVSSFVSRDSVTTTTRDVVTKDTDTTLQLGTSSLSNCATANERKSQLHHVTTAAGLHHSTAIGTIHDNNKRMMIFGAGTNESNPRNNTAKRVKQNPYL